jgi:LacI family transcriptional regulator
MSVTIKDIAKALGISYSSVSRALNNKPEVSNETKKRVIAQAKKMGYQPNDIARGLVKKQSNTIGVIIPDIANSYFGEVTEGIIDTANKNGYTVLLCISNWDLNIEKKYLKILQEKRVDGIILKPCKDDVNRNFKNEIKVPYIILEGWPTDIKHSSVEVDNIEGGYIATKYLLEQKYKNIAFIGGLPHAFSTIHRIKGYINALKDYKIEMDKELLLFGEFTINSGYNLAKQLLNSKKNVDAIFAGNDIIALGVLDYATTHGYNIPNELGIIGFDDIFYSQLPQIQLTTMHQPKYDLGKYTLEILLEEIGNEKDKIDKKILLQPKLIVRKTTR